MHETKKLEYNDALVIYGLMISLTGRPTVSFGFNLRNLFVNGGTSKC